MILATLRDRSLVFEDAWGALRQKWRAAPSADQVILEDGRPAVRLYVEDGRVAYQSVPPAVWGEIKGKLAMRSQLIGGGPIAHPKRGRLCVTCGAALEVTKEYGSAWCFRCPICRAVEVFGKDVIGGTVGAGDVEKT
jgi:hypothetical protein